MYVVKWQHCFHLELYPYPIYIKFLEKKTAYKKPRNTANIFPTNVISIDTYNIHQIPPWYIHTHRERACCYPADVKSRGIRARRAPIDANIDVSNYIFFYVSSLSSPTLSICIRVYISPPIHDVNTRVCDCRQVLPGLYVGNYRDSKDAAQLERFEITHILAIHDAAKRLHSVSSVCVRVSDGEFFLV